MASDILSKENVALFAAFLAFAASLTGTAVSLYNARAGRFVSERWWERKANAYSEILEILAKVRLQIPLFEAYMKLPGITQEQKSEQFNNLAQLVLEMRQARLRWSFVISTDVDNSLEQGRQEIVEVMETCGKVGSFESLYKDLPSLVEKAIASIRELARYDLSVPG